MTQSPPPEPKAPGFTTPPGPETGQTGSPQTGDGSVVRGSGRESRKALAFVARLATEFTTVLSLPDLLEHVIRLLGEEMEFDSCAIALIDAHDPDLLTIRATSGLQTSALGQSFRRGTGLGWATIESGAPLIIPDLLADPRAALQLSQRRSALMVPLFVHGKAIGLVNAFRDRAGAFSEAELNLLTVVARYLTGAIEVARLHEQLRELASTDALTGLANRRIFIDRLRSEIERSRRAQCDLSVALLDLDRFKQVNDTYGHAAGDEILLRVAEMLTAGIRAYDLAGRFGGDEFTLLFPQTPRAQAEDVLRRLRPPEIATPDGAGSRVSVGFCWGTAAWPADGEEAEGLLQVADQRLYAMKQERAAQTE